MFCVEVGIYGHENPRQRRGLDIERNYNNEHNGSGKIDVCGSCSYEEKMKMP